jgi:hypothetical protein
LLFDSSKGLVLHHGVTHSDFEFSHFPCFGGKHKCVHLHGFNSQQMIILFNLLADLRDNGDDPSSKRAWNVV